MSGNVMGIGVLVLLELVVLFPNAMDRGLGTRLNDTLLLL